MIRSSMRDPDLPGLAVIANATAFIPSLSRSLTESGRTTGAVEAVRLLRIRHRPGERAILSAALDIAGQVVPASIWLHAGTKGQRLTQKGEHPGPVLEPLSGALIYLFPDDPHVPQIRAFDRHPATYAEALLPDAKSPERAPQLIRFRPGLGATFRWMVRSNESYFVKIQKYGSACQSRDHLIQIGEASKGKRFAVPRTAGADAAINAYSMHEVSGSSYRDLLSQGSALTLAQATRQVLDAISSFHHCGVRPAHARLQEDFISTACSSARGVSRLRPDLATLAEDLANSISSAAPDLQASLTHGDIKTEHIILSNGSVTLLDLDDTTRSDPLYDIAMLEVRIAAEAASAYRSNTTSDLAREMIGTVAGDTSSRYRYGWLRACAALQVAKHFAQALADDERDLAAVALALGAKGLAECRRTVSRRSAPVAHHVPCSQTRRPSPCG